MNYRNESKRSKVIELHFEIEMMFKRKTKRMRRRDRKLKKINENQNLNEMNTLMMRPHCQVDWVMK